MNQNWNDFLRQQGLRNNGKDFGHVPDELNAARSATILVPLTDIGLIRVSGEDAAVFLNNLLTNDVKGLGTDTIQRNGLCNPKGRLLATFVIWRDNADFVLALSTDLHTSVLKKLSMYVLRAKVKLSDAGNERVLVGISGPEATKALGETSPSSIGLLKTARIEPGQVLRLADRRYLLDLDATLAPSAWLEMARLARPAGLEAWHWLEIIAGMPIVSAVTQEEFVPQMLNFELIGGVSFKKGCYPGQEIVARTQHLGKIKRRMYCAHLDTSPIAGAHLYAPETGDQSCGRVVSSAMAPDGGYDLLAVIQTTCVETGEVHLDSISGPRLVFQPLPYPVDVTNVS